MFPHRCWYRAAWSSEVKRKPLHRKMLMQDVALFRTADGQVHAVNAVCPHRGANLAEGEVIDDCLRCPFHGLSFNTDGACTRMPFQPADIPIPKLARVAAYPVREICGVIWIWMDSEYAPDVEPDTFPAEVLQPGALVMRAKSECQSASYLMTMETAMEDTHIPYIHRHTLNRLQTNGEMVSAQRVLEVHADELGFTCQRDPENSWWPDGTVGGAAREVSARTAADPAGLAGKRYIRLGGQVYFDLSAEGLGYILAFATPCDEDSTWFATLLVLPASTPIFKKLSTYITMQLLQQGVRVMGEDRRANELLLVKQPGNLANPVSNKTEAHLIQFRKMWFAALEREGREKPPTWVRPTPWQKQHEP